MRYTIEEIRQMPEGQTFDCKSIHIEPKALANTIVAMANADGGMIAVGISDKTRRIEGVDQDKAHLNEILRTPFDFCVPTISVTTEFMPCQDSEGNDNHILIINILNGGIVGRTVLIIAFTLVIHQLQTFLKG